MEAGRRSSCIVGPCQGCNDYWGGIDAAGVIERACQLDDEFIFYDDGTMEIDTQGQVWVENFLGGANECIDESMLMSPFDAFASGTLATADANEVTVNGLGAYIGWNKPFNGVSWQAMPVAALLLQSPTKCLSTPPMTALND